MKNQVSIAAHALYQKLPFVVKYIATKVKAMASTATKYGGKISGTAEPFGPRATFMQQR